MNNIKTINNIGYEGFVNFKIYEKKKLRNNFTIHNAGQAGLFNFLATCLSGKLEATAMPKYLYLNSIFVIFGIVRYMQLTFVENASGDPARVLLKDRKLQFCVLLWLVSFSVFMF